jgi:predicted enzyme related to lactoylglutathione lyase
MDRAVSFYRDVLGLTENYVSQHWSTLHAGPTRIGLHPPFERSQEVRGGGWVFGLEVSDIAAFRAKLEAAGVSCTEYHETPGGAIFDFADPDGNRLQAMQPGVFVKDLPG